MKLTKAGEPRKRAPGAGRPKSGKIKLTVHILPETRTALGSKPGESIDALFRQFKVAHYPIFSPQFSEQAASTNTENGKLKTKT